jgi:2-polyprenyl-3-methyl-5-hydroxy-6-metoxy-1,4-benzoquinol methylase
VLDVGAGIGYGSAILADAPTVESVVSFERSPESLEYAKAHYDRGNIARHEVDLDGVDLFTGSGAMADSATAFEIIEHLARPEPLLTSLPAERLFASVPNEAVIPYSPEIAPFHQRHYTKAQFEALLQATGWRVNRWYGQQGRESPVLPYTPDCRTLIVDAVRCPPPAL